MFKGKFLLLAALSLCVPGTLMSAEVDKSILENISPGAIRLVLTGFHSPELEKFLDETDSPEAMANLIEAYNSLYPEDASRPKTNQEVKDLNPDFEPKRIHYLKRLTDKPHRSNQEALKKLLVKILRQDSQNWQSRQYAAKTLGNMELNAEEIEALRYAAKNDLVESVRDEAQKSYDKVSSLRGRNDCGPKLTDDLPE